MLYNTVIENSKKYGPRPCINDISWRELPEIIRRRTYVPFTRSVGVNILLDILKAASVDRPIIVPPLAGDCLYKDPGPSFSLTLYSSGSTGGFKKPITLSEGVIMANARNSIEAHGFTGRDRVLTVSSMNHTGGINAQTIPALIAGAHVVIEDKFEPHKFWDIIAGHDITVTHLVPRMIDTLIKIGGRGNSPLRLVTCGSDCVKGEHVAWWLDNGVPFMINYGMTEAGPITVNHCFNPGDDLLIFDLGVPLGTRRWCDSRVVDGELHLQGDSVTGDDWLFTDDCVEEWGEWLIYRGRKSAGCKIIPKSY